MKTRQLLIVVMFLFAFAAPVWADDQFASTQAAFYASIKNRAAQGDARAQTFLGDIYSEGAGVPQDYVQAHKWLNLAAAASQWQAAETRDYVASQMTPAQIAEAQKLASEWKKK